jgi:hypothetical protein
VIVGLSFAEHRAPRFLVTVGGTDIKNGRYQSPNKQLPWPCPLPQKAKASGAQQPSLPWQQAQAALQLLGLLLSLNAAWARPSREVVEECRIQRAICLRQRTACLLRQTSIPKRPYIESPNTMAANENCRFAHVPLIHITPKTMSRPPTIMAPGLGHDSCDA